MAYMDVLGAGQQIPLNNEQLSGMRINFRKCDLMPINVELDDAQLLSQTLSCKIGKFPIVGTQNCRATPG
jgi:hypothetical protein